METEKWNPINGYENYQVSTRGEVKNKDGRVLKPSPDGKGYLSITLSKNGFVKRHLLHRLVALAFIPNPENKATINHINGNKLDNNLENLERATQSENNAHAYRTGLSQKHPQHGEKNGRAKLTLSDVSVIRKFLRQGESVKTIAAQFGVTSKQISHIGTGKSWVN